MKKSYSFKLDESLMRKVKLIASATDKKLPEVIEEFLEKESKAFFQTHGIDETAFDRVLGIKG